MDSRTAELLMHGRKAANLARDWGHPEDADDASQYVIEQRLKGRKGCVSHILIDYLRETHGSTRVSGGRKGQKRETRAAISGEGLEVADPRVIDVGSRVDAEHLLRHLDSTSRAVFLLKHVWGLSEAEISNLFGVSESRIYQRLKGVESCLSKAQKEGRSFRPTKRRRGISQVGCLERQEISCEAFTIMARSESGEMEGFDEPRFEKWLT